MARQRRESDRDGELTWRRRCAPTEALGGNLRLEVAVRNVVRPGDRKQDLLDDLAVGIAELRLQRHRRLFVEPQPVAEPELVLRHDRDQPGVAAEHRVPVHFASMV